LPRVLSFNIADPEKRNELNILSLRLNFSLVPVPPEKQGCLISDLLAGKDSAPGAFTPFTEEMLVLADFEKEDLNFLLNELIRTGQRVALKAVATPTNRGWTACRLAGQLKAENLAMARKSSQAKGRG